MNKGIDINTLAKRVLQQKEAKRDFIANSKCIRLKADGETLEINGGDLDLDFNVTQTCHRQIGSTLGIPVKYYDKLRENSSSLLAQNVNWWLHTEPQDQMVRTFDYQSIGAEDQSNTARAFLSKKYRPLDNCDLIDQLVPLVTDRGADIKSCNLTDNYFYFHACFPDIEAEITEGDVVRAGISIRNSEVGLSSLKVYPWIERLACMNGMTVADSGVRKYHVGKSLASSDIAYELMSDDTKQKTDKAFWAQVQDVVKATMEEAKFQTIINSYREKAKIEVAEPAKAVEITSDRFRLTKDESKSMLQFLCEDGDYSQWGVANSVTRLAHDEKSYDRAVELTEIGGEVMELPQSAWSD